MKFEIFHEEHLGDQPKVFDANNAKNAALMYSEYYNRKMDGNPLMGESVKIDVVGNGMTTTFSIGAEPDIRYTANAV